MTTHKHTCPNCDHTEIVQGAVCKCITFEQIGMIVYERHYWICKNCKGADSDDHQNHQTPRLG